MVVGSQPETGFDRAEVERELSQLHILLLGVKADVEDVISPARPPGSATDLKRGVSKALTCLDALRARLREG